MKLNRIAYQTKFTHDEKTLLIVGRIVSIWEFNDEKPIEKHRIKALKDPNYITLSSDEKLFAYNNTLGHIAIGDMKTGEIITKSKGTNTEGDSLMFCCNDRKILSSDWNGNIFTLDIASSEVTVIAKLPTNRPSIYYSDNNSQVIIMDYDHDINSHIDNGYLRVWELSLLDKNSLSEVTVSAKFSTICNDVSSRTNNSIYFFDYKGYVYSMPITSKQIEKVFNIHDLLNTSGKLVFKHSNYINICVSSDEKYLLLGFDEIVVAFNLLEKKCIGMLTIENKVVCICDLHFFYNDTKVLIGTTSGLQSVDFPNAFTPL